MWRALGFAVALGSVACSSSTSTAGDFVLRSTDGERYRLSDFHGDVVMVQFFASWSKPSRSLLTQLPRIQDKYAERGLVVWGVAVDGPETIAQVAAVARSRGAKIPILLDEDTSVVAHYNPKRIVPYTVFIGREGRVVDRWNGHNFGDREALDAHIERALERHAR